VNNRRRHPLTLIVLASFIAFARPAGAQLAGPFARVDVVKLVLGTPGVSRDAARSTQSAVWVNVEGQTSGGVVRAGLASGGQTINGDWLLAVPLDSGKATGAFVALVYRSTGGAAEYIAALDSKRGLLRVTVLNGHLIVEAPLFAKRDLPCCPSAMVTERMLYSPGTDGLIVVTTQRMNLNRPPSPHPQSS